MATSRAKRLYAPLRRSTSGSAPNLGRERSSAEAAAPGLASGQSRSYWLVSAAVTVVLCGWLFWPTLARLVHTWQSEQDYSHGFLVIPVAALLLWYRRDSLPARSIVPGWGGLGLVLVSIVVRYLGERMYLVPLTGWSLVLWLAGSCWLLAGRRILVWALPGLLFLSFMVPLPFRFEEMLSWRLQSVATRVSTVLLQCLGQNAIAEGHTIFLGDHVLEVEQACSGLRMFMGIAAVAFAFVVMNRRPWWEKLILMVSMVPVALLANAIRIVVTGLLMQLVSGEAAAKFSHDAAGWAMIGVAVGLFGMLVAFLRRVVVEVAPDTARDLLRRSVVA